MREKFKELEKSLMKEETLTLLNKDQLINLVLSLQDKMVELGELIVEHFEDTQEFNKFQKDSINELFLLFEGEIKNEKKRN